MLYLKLRQYEYVIAIANLGSMSAAAAALNVSQPALSVAVQAVEQKIGHSLFIRKKGSPLTPTTYGRLFLGKAKDLVASAQRLETNQIQPRAKFRLGCFEDLAPRWLAPSLKHLREDFPDMQIVPFVSNFDTLAKQVSQGELDLAITFDLGLDATFEKKVVAKSHPNIFVPFADNLAKRASVRLAEVGDRPLILFEEGLSIRHMLDLFSKRGIRPSVRHRVGSLELMRSFAANGEGVGISYSAVKNDTSYDGAEVACIPIADADTAEDIVIAYKMDMLVVAPIAEAISSILKV